MIELKITDFLNETGSSTQAYPAVHTYRPKTLRGTRDLLDFFFLYISLCFFYSALLDFTSTGVGQGKKFLEMSLVGSWSKII